jgi:two-component system cell cycle sensor histidine kinase/response regulator CckA
MQEVAADAPRFGRAGAFEREISTGAAHWSPELLNVLGLDPPGPKDVETFVEMVHPDDRPGVEAAMARGLAEARAYQYVCRVSVQGVERLVQVHADFLRDQQGTPWRIVGIVQDITEWDRSRAALKESEALRAAVVDSALDSVMVVDAGGIVVEWNRAAEVTFGYRRADALGREIVELVVPQSARERCRRILARSHQAGGVNMLGRRVEVTAQRKGGEEFPVELSVAEVPGERPLYAGYVRDITGRRAAEAARRSAQERWRALVEQIPAVTYLCKFDEPSTALYISPQIEELLGFHPDEWSEGSDSWLERVHPDDRERVRAEARARFEQSRGFSCVYRVLSTDGELRWIDERSSVIRDESGEPRFLQGVMVDVTATRRRDEELRETQRLESVGQLAGGIAHDFNNLLGIIHGYAEMLEAEVPSRLGADVAEIRRAASRAADLTRQLLLFSRREPVQAAAVDVNAVAIEMRDMLARTVGEHVGFNMSLETGPCVAEIPRRHLEQILVNLAVNARDAMPDGGQLTVATARAGEWIVLRMADDGAGMPPDVVARAFDPFFTTKERGRGTGLGLATVYGVVMQAGGQVELDSEPQAGTIVTIVLPAADEVPAPAQWGDEPTRGRGETVLVVEDEEGVRELTGRILRESGYRVMRAKDGRDARALLSEHDGVVDLLVSDVVMPGMSGPQVAEQLKELRPGLKVLFMSGHPEDLLDHHGVADGSTRLLEKPFDSRALLEAVRDTLGGG